MPYKKCEPADDVDMRKKRYFGHHTICEKCREIWRMGRELNNPELMLKAREAMAMGKRMHEKLKEYKSYRESGENYE
ncbi:MAG: hypothetical protein ABIC57_03165, partial [bacterium]